MAVQDRIPSDPRKKAEYEEAAKKLAITQADQAQAGVRMREEVAQKEAIAKQTEKDHAAEAKDKERTNAERVAAKNKARQAYLETPLTERETAELEALEAQCNKHGCSSPEIDMMRRLGDLRVRAKVKAVDEKPDKQEDQGGKKSKR
jgi:hypothetical protein